MNVFARKKNINPVMHLKIEFGITQLHRACYLADIEMVENAIKRGTNVNVKVNSDSPYWQGFTPLHCTSITVFKNNEEQNFIDRIKKIIELLIKHGADPLIKDSNNETCLHVIKKMNHINQFALINKIFSFTSRVFRRMKNFKTNPTDNEGLSLFHIACVTQNKRAIQKFLKNCVDVNQVITGRSNFVPYRTPIELVLRYYCLLSNCSSNRSFSERDILQMIDLLRKNNAKVNVTDANGETLLFQAVISRKSRYVLIKKLISIGVNVNVINIHGITAFQILLQQRDVSQKEIELFLAAGYLLHTHYNTKNQEGYLIEFFRYLKENQLQLKTITISKLWDKIIENRNIIGVDNTGRTAIHNVVSNQNTDWCTTVKQWNRQDKGKEKILWINPIHKDDSYESFCIKMIRKLLFRGCDIDRQDNEGQTALHLAIKLRNLSATRELLKNGADINLIDGNGSTAFAYDSLKPPNLWYFDRSYYDSCIEFFFKHIFMLNFFGYPVNEQNKQFNKKYKRKSSYDRYTFETFFNDIEYVKSTKIGNTSLTMYEFLVNTEVSKIYKNMTYKDRLEVDKFFKNIDENINLREIKCLFKLKYRGTIEKIKLFESGLASFNVLMKYQMPDLCCRIIVKLLETTDLKCMIATVS